MAKSKNGRDWKRERDQFEAENVDLREAAEKLVKDLGTANAEHSAREKKFQAEIHRLRGELGKAEVVVKDLKAELSMMKNPTVLDRKKAEIETETLGHLSRLTEIGSRYGYMLQVLKDGDGIVVMHFNAEKSQSCKRMLPTLASAGAYLTLMIDKDRRETFEDFVLKAQQLAPKTDVSALPVLRGTNIVSQEEAAKIDAASKAEGERTP